MDISINNKIDETINTYNSVVNEYIEYYNSKDLNGGVQHQKEIDYLISQLDNNAKILDVGTAIGIYAKFLTEKCDKNFDVLGIDSSKNMLKKAIQNAPKAKFELMDIREMNYQSKSFDAIICLGVLNHLNDDICKNVLYKFNDLLKDGGLLLINAMELNGEEKEIFIPEPLNTKYKTYFNRYMKNFFLDFFEKNNYLIEKSFDNKLFNEEKSGKDFVGTNKFSIIARKM